MPAVIYESSDFDSPEQTLSEWRHGRMTAADRVAVCLVPAGIVCSILLAFVCAAGLALVVA